jgi:hypothetical protein
MRDLSDDIGALRRRLDEASGYLKVEELRARQPQLETEASRPDLWDDQDRARKVTSELTSVNDDLTLYDDLHTAIDDVATLHEMAREEGDDSLEPEIDAALVELAGTFAELELRSLFSGEHDDADGVCEILSGAGGTDSQDWAEMLLRMYLRWAERKGFEVELDEVGAGQEAGITTATFIVKGRYAYGLLQAERGVHRLVRISPFDSAAQGSVWEPRLIVLEYRGGNEDARPVVLVGKGVVFDAGGISLKPAEKMDEMTREMAGGAAVLGTLYAAALLRLPVNLVGIIPAVENLPSGSTLRPGDILTSLSGRTIEVLNTDAEGRLILADALTFARRFEPRVVIDLATLTGACVIALGHHASAVLGTHEGLVRQLLKAGETSGERLWQLPLWSDYAAQLKSDIADLKNIGGRPAGTITAAAFLQKFAEGLTWAHIDIAGTAWEEKGRPCVPRGATGVGVRLLIEFLK